MPNESTEESEDEDEVLLVDRSCRWSGTRVTGGGSLGTTGTSSFAGWSCRAKRRSLMLLALPGVPGLSRTRILGR